MEAIGSNMTTDLSFSDMQSLIAYATADNGLQVETLTLAGTDGRVDNKYIYQLDETALAETKSILQQHLGITKSLQSDSNSTTDTDTTVDTESNTNTNTNTSTTTDTSTLN